MNDDFCHPMNVPTVEGNGGVDSEVGEFHLKDIAMGSYQVRREWIAPSTPSVPSYVVNPSSNQLCPEDIARPDAHGPYSTAFDPTAPSLGYVSHTRDAGVDRCMTDPNGLTAGLLRPFPVGSHGEPRDCDDHHSASQAMVPEEIADTTGGSWGWNDLAALGWNSRSGPSYNGSGRDTATHSGSGTHVHRMTLLQKQELPEENVPFDVQGMLAQPSERPSSAGGSDTSFTQGPSSLADPSNDKNSSEVTRNRRIRVSKHRSHKMGLIDDLSTAGARIAKQTGFSRSNVSKKNVRFIAKAMMEHLKSITSASQAQDTIYMVTRAGSGYAVEPSRLSKLDWTNIRPLNVGWTQKNSLMMYATEVAVEPLQATIAQRKALLARVIGGFR